MRNFVLAILSCGLLSACAGTYDPVSRGVQGVELGMPYGCAMGALMTIWAGPLATAGCAMGAISGASFGMMMGVATAPSSPVIVPGP